MTVDMGTGRESLYDDQGEKVLDLPAADPGNVVGFEYETEEKPEHLQFPWFVQNVIPVLRATFELTLPAGWELKTVWRNEAPIVPQVSGNTYSWQMTEVPAIEVVDRMPSWQAIAGSMTANVFPSSAASVKHPYLTWEEVAGWYAGVIAGRSVANEKVTATAQRLTANSSDWVGKVAALAGFVQSKVRYVSISIGRGGYEPHFPEEVLLYSYGDCKDKATLLSALLKAVGIRSYVVLASTDTDRVTDDFPSTYTFNHAILAILKPPDVNLADAYAVVPVNGEQLVFFDPTDDHTPLGQLPDYLQGNRVLVAAAGTSALTHLPLPKPEANALARKAKISVRSDGSIAGEVVERRSGSLARILRAYMLSAKPSEQRQYVERFLNVFVNGATVQSYNLENLADDKADLVLSYNFEAPGYVRHGAGLTTMRARILGQKTDISFEADRKYPLEVGVPSLQTDEFEVVLPPGASAEELPDPTDVRTDYAEYVSRTEVHEMRIEYARAYRIKNGFVPVDHLKEMKSFYRAVAADERANIVLKGMQ